MLVARLAGFTAGTMTLGWVLHWAALPGARELWASLDSDTHPVSGWTLDHLVAAAASCLSLVVATVLALSAVLTITVHLLALRLPVFQQVLRLTGPRWWRGAVLGACGLGLVIPATVASATDARVGDGAPCRTDCASPLAGLPFPDLQGRGPRGPASFAPTVDSPPSTVVVRAGDSLWRIVAADLGPAADDVTTAYAVQRLFAANRASIGDDPDLIFPGTRLILTRRPR